MNDDRLKNTDAITLNSILDEHYQKQPVHGAIIMNKEREKFLLVQCDFSKKYGFVKGKVEENEEKYDCAKR